MAVGGIGGIVAQAPVGALVDRTTAKRALIIAGALTITAGSLAMPMFPGFTSISALQALTGIAGSVFAPALAAITLGVVGPRRFARRIGRNESFNHAGNASAAAITGGLAYFFGPVVVFWVLALMAAASVAATLRIPGDAIDHDVARGMDHAPGEAHGRPSRLSVLWHNRRLMIFAAAVVAFHFANAAMLPLVGQLLAMHNKDVGTALMAVCIVAAQVVMVPVAYLAGAKADSWGRKPLFLFGFAVLAARGFLYTLSGNSYWLVGVQFLDGVGAGIFGALFPLVVQDVTHGPADSTSAWVRSLLRRVSGPPCRTTSRARSWSQRATTRRSSRSAGWPVRASCCICSRCPKPRPKNGASDASGFRRHGCDQRSRDQNHSFVSYSSVARR
jgi:MFS family permease